jgi:hypothetical protein
VEKPNEKNRARFRGNDSGEIMKNVLFDVKKLR